MVWSGTACGGLGLRRRRVGGPARGPDGLWANKWEMVVDLIPSRAGRGGGIAGQAGWAWAGPSRALRVVQRVVALQFGVDGPLHLFKTAMQNFFDF